MLTLLSWVGLSAPTPAEFLQMAPMWCTVVSALEDLWKGYRQNHAIARDRGLCVTTFVHPRTRQRVYSKMYGLPFGFAVVVFQFNRAPMVFTACLRRTLCCIAGHYVDDNTMLALARWAGWSKNLHVRVLTLFGALVSHAKRTLFRSVSPFLGHINDFAVIRTDAAVIFGAKPSTRVKTMDWCDHLLH